MEFDNGRYLDWWTTLKMANPTKERIIIIHADKNPLVILTRRVHQANEKTREGVPDDEFYPQCFQTWQVNLHLPKCFRKISICKTRLLYFLMSMLTKKKWLKLGNNSWCDCTHQNILTRWMACDLNYSKWACPNLVLNWRHCLQTMQVFSLIIKSAQLFLRWQGQSCQMPH